VWIEIILLPDKELDRQGSSEIRIDCSQHNGTKSEILHTIFLACISTLKNLYKLLEYSI